MTIPENDLTQEEFLDAFKEGISEELSGHDLQMTTQMVHKANEDLEGLTIRMDGSSISPTLYPDKLYDDYTKGRDLEEMVRTYSSLIKETPEFDLNGLTAEEAKSHINFSLVNTAANKDWLETIPHEEIGDLSAVPRWYLDEITDGKASFVVSEHICQTLKLTQEEVLDIARINTENDQYSVKSMYETMTEMMRGQGLSDDDIKAMAPDDMRMYVITNESKIDGASCLLSDKVLQEAYEKIGEDFIILPSSRHEVIAIPASTCEDPEYLKGMVENINETQLDRQDYLSDNIYQYDGQTHQLSPMFDEQGRLIEPEEHSSIDDDKDELDHDGMGGR